MKIFRNKYLIIGIKILVSATCISILFIKIDVNNSLRLFRNIELSYFFAAFLLFGLSKYLSAERLNIYLKSIHIDIGRSTNIKLYLLGMFYNLFLPGGIGGDGYKTYYLYKRNPDIKLKKIVGTLLLDRLSGFIMLLILTLGFIWTFNWDFPFENVIIGGGVVLLLITFYGLHRLRKNVSAKLQISSLIYSFGVQISQLLCMYCIIYSFNSPSHVTELLFVFLLSTITVMLPISIGGVGLRELTFVYLSPMFKYEETISVSMALIFFLISVVYSICGIFYVWKPEQIDSEIKFN